LIWFYGRRWNGTSMRYGRKILYTITFACHCLQAVFCRRLSVYRRIVYREDYSGRMPSYHTNLLTMRFNRKPDGKRAGSYHDGESSPRRFCFHLQPYISAQYHTTIQTLLVDSHAPELSCFARRLQKAGRVFSISSNMVNCTQTRLK